MVGVSKISVVLCEPASLFVPLFERHHWNMGICSTPRTSFDCWTGLLSQTNPGIKHIRKISLQLEKTVIASSRTVVDDSDDSSDEEPEVKFENISGAARQAQFTVRLLIDFLPNDILENFRCVVFDLTLIKEPTVEMGIISTRSTFQQILNYRTLY